MMMRLTLIVVTVMQTTVRAVALDSCRWRLDIIYDGNILRYSEEWVT
jgi:hypothetical protein